VIVLAPRPGRRRRSGTSCMPSASSLKRASTCQRRTSRMGRGDRGPPRRTGKTRETHRAASRCGWGTAADDQKGFDRSSSFVDRSQPSPAAYPRPHENAPSPT